MVDWVWGRNQLLKPGCNELRVRCAVWLGVRATHTPMLLVPRVAQIDSLPIKKIGRASCRERVLELV